MSGSLQRPIQLRIRFKKNLVDDQGAPLYGLYVMLSGSGKATIYLDADLSAEKATEILLHEFGHMAFDFENFQNENGPKDLDLKYEHPVCNEIARDGRKRMVRAWRLSDKSGK